MANDRRDKIINERMAQALIMRDVMDGLEDFASMQAFDPWPGQFEIISIESPGAESQDAEELKHQNLKLVVNSVH